MRTSLFHAWLLLVTLTISQLAGHSVAQDIFADFAFPGRAPAENFESWNLEPSLRQAHLVMVARLQRVSEKKVVEGAKTDVVMREYRFQPIRVLKGIFQREQLSMTAADLGLPAETVFSKSPLEEGEFRLLVLAPSSGQQQLFRGESLAGVGCVVAAPGVTSFAERVPLLAGPDDPIIGVAETLITVADERSRSERAKLLVDELQEADGVAAIPLLTSLGQRADWAAADDRVMGPLARLIRHSDAAVRGAATRLLEEVLANRRVEGVQEGLDEVATAVKELLESDEARTSTRLNALNALGHIRSFELDFEWGEEFLIDQLTKASTYAERDAALGSLARSGRTPSGDVMAAVTSVFSQMPLDAAPARELAYARAVTRLLPTSNRPPLGDVVSARAALESRLLRSLAAQQSIAAEVSALGQLGSKESLPLLLSAANLSRLVAADRHQLAWALGRIGDDRGVPQLVDWLTSGDSQLKEAALTALERIDTPLAAQEVRPLLKVETYLANKLRFARLLARHGIADGYTLATEHLSDAGQTAAAALVLMALDDPRTAGDLRKILDGNPARRWHAAALTGLAAIGDAKAIDELRTILADDRHPLVVDAAHAAGLTDDPTLLPPLAKLVHSRNRPIAEASLVALRQFLSEVRVAPAGLAAVKGDKESSSEPASLPDLPADVRDAVMGPVVSLAKDTYVDANLRGHALDVARLLGGDSYRELLTELADQSELEGTPLLAKVQQELRRQ